MGGGPPDAPPSLPTSGWLRIPVAGEPAPDLRLRGEIARGPAARPWVGWIVQLFGAVALVGAYGPWYSATAIYTPGAALNGRWSALSIVGGVVVGILIACGLGTRIVCALGTLAFATSAGFALTAFGDDRLEDVGAHPAWGLVVCVSVSVFAGLVCALGIVCRAPYRRTIDVSAALAQGPSSSRARSEPQVGVALAVCGLLAVAGSIGPWTSELLGPDQVGIHGDGVLTLVAAVMLLGFGALIMFAVASLVPAIFALVAATLGLLVAFADYAAVRKLTIPFVVRDVEFSAVAWGLHLVLVAFLAAIALSIRALTRRGVVEPATVPTTQ